MIEIKRDAYLQQLTMRKDNGMIKVITGIRRLLRLPWMVLRMRN